MAVTARTGQVFIVGTLLFAALIVGVVFLSQGGGIQAVGPETPKVLFEKGLDEFPRAVNLAAAENDSARHVRNQLVSYLAFQEYVVERHGAGDRAHAVVTVPNSTGVSAVVANFRGQAMEDVKIVVDGAEKTVGSIPDGEARIHTFTDVSPQFRVNLSFSADATFDHSVTASRDRLTALYRLEVESAEQLWQDTEIY